MKITNESKIKLYSVIVLVLLALLITSEVIIFSLNISVGIIFEIGLFIIIILLTMLFSGMKIYTFEDSGEVITIKKSHILSFGNITYPFAEFPKNNIGFVQIRTSVMKQLTDVSFILNNKRRSCLKCSVLGLSCSQIDQLRTITNNFYK